MKNLLLDALFDGSQFWRRSSFAQWLLGALLTVAAGLLLYALRSPQQKVLPSSLAKANSCLQAAGSDLKHGELLAHDASCTCTTSN
jgi:hypothetical protein